MADDRLVTFSVTQKMITERCCSCGVLFAVPLDFYNARRRDQSWFYCPSGHQQRYTGETEAQRLQKKLDAERRERQRAEQSVAMWQDDARAARDEAEHQRRRANGYKGHAARITKRAKAGTCPCCNRTFQQLARHMATQHPHFTPEAPELLRVVGGKDV